jgi:hypothetical protein
LGQTDDGETADDSQEQWWGFTKSGEYVETGVDATDIEDGDHFEFTLNVRILNIGRNGALRTNPLSPGFFAISDLLFGLS